MKEKMGNYKDIDRRDTMVYFHRRNDDNSIFYVGIGVGRRPYVKQSRNTHWYNIVNKVGYTVEIVHEGLTWDEGCEYEIKYIKDFGRNDKGLGPLVNMTDGGDGTLGQQLFGEDNSFYGKTHTEEFKKERSEYMTGLLVGEKNGMYGRTHTQESINKIISNRRSYEGKENPFYGKTHTEEVIEKIKEYNRTRVLGDEWRENMRKNCWDKPKSKEERQRISEQTKGEGNPNSKLTKEDVLWIRENYKPRHKVYGRVPMSKKFNISITMVSKIMNKESWSHI